MTCSPGQWDGLLKSAYESGWILLEIEEIDGREEVVRAWKKGDGTKESRSEPVVTLPTTETSSYHGNPLRMFHTPYGHSDEESFVFFFNRLQAKAHANAVDKGFWETERSDGESIALMHSELSEALEALRQGNPPDDKVPQHSGAAAEFGDTIIRIMDLAGKRGWNVAQAMIDKMEFNAQRAYKHGKEF